jgi:L-lactate dehydrogenase complex protein LldG
MAIARATGTTPEELVGALAARAGKLGVRTHRLADLDALAALVAELVADGGPAAFAPTDGAGWRAIVAPAAEALHPGLTAHLEEHGVALTAADAADPERASVGVAVGLSLARHGVAETGTLLVADTLVDRLVRMLAPKHVMILDARDILPSLDEAGARLRALIAAGPDGPGRYMTFITGPSRTADIEMSLTVGAHGPAEVHLAILGAATDAR